MEIFRRREKDLIREDACKYVKTWLVHLPVNARRVHGSGGSDALASRGWSSRRVTQWRCVSCGADHAIVKAGPRLVD